MKTDMNHEPIQLIIAAAAHRSGSTLLQRICNHREKTLIWGEHGGVLQQFVDIYGSLEHYAVNGSPERNSFFSSEANARSGLWIANMSPELSDVTRAVTSSVHALFSTLYAHSPDGSSYDTVGFKEVRYGPDELRLFRMCFPNAWILLLVRRPEDTYASAPHWYEKIEDLTDKWNKNAAFYHTFAQHDARTLLVTYEALIEQEELLLEKLSRVIQVPVADIKKILQLKVGSFRTKDLSSDIAEQIRHRCQVTMRLFDYK
ncbi:sulfotransferase [Paenibacillus sp. YYML68]|uniref:sulfotransferase n=1 Tax=Paenibacillus sp. YYML68 TaxID=2909250 RepID=UPI0024934BC6|nr:sulfotransferase [Paenibacillus sp. YYML68]